MILTANPGHDSGAGGKVSCLEPRAVFVIMRCTTVHYYRGDTIVQSLQYNTVTIVIY